MRREEAIEILSDMRAEYNLFGDEKEETRYHVLSWAIQDMKAAQPERKRGHWKEDWLASTSGGAYQVWRCSECESAFNWRMKYCGHCGAKMDEVEK